MLKWALNKIYKVMLLLGVALILSAFISNISLNSFMNHAVDGTAVIDEIEGTRFLTDEPNVTVDYYVEGKKYSAKLKYYEDTMDEGDTVPILYNPDYPKNMRAKNAESPVKSLYRWGIMLSVASAVMYLITAYLDKKHKEKKAERKAAKKLQKQQNKKR